MKNRLILPIVCLSLVVVTVLAACQTPTTQNQTQVVTGVTKTTTGGSSIAQTTTIATGTVPVPPPVTSNIDKTPVYGGSVNFVRSNPTRWDPGELAWGDDPAGVHQGIITVDVARGPQGTNEFPMNTQSPPDWGYTGLLAESYEVLDPRTAIFHLQQGVKYFATNPKIPGYGREMIAADAVAAMDRTQLMPRSQVYRPLGKNDPQFIVTSVMPDDKYALKVKLTFNMSNIWDFEMRGSIYPPESVAAYDPAQWQNGIGTGAFVASDYIPDSSITYTGNKNYWRYDPLHPTFKLPYLDGMRYLIMDDPATQQAALQTGKVAIMGFSRDRGTYLLKNNPELKYSTRPDNYVPVIFLRTDKAPFNNLQVRRALAMAIDRQGILKDYYQGQGNLLAWPQWESMGNTIYTPLDKMPADVQELYTQNATKAKQLLKDAGFENGFPIQLDVPTVEIYTDQANIVKSYWDAIGCTTTIKVIEAGTFYANMSAKNYQQAGFCPWSNSAKTSAVGWAWRSNQIYNYCLINDPKVDAAYKAALDETDVPKRDKILKDISVYGAQQSWEIPLPQPVSYVFWQPWLKGFAGEYGFPGSMMWVDAALRKSMGQ